MSGAVLENRNHPVCMSLMLGSGSNENDPDPSHHEYPGCDSIGTRFMVDETTYPSEIRWSMPDMRRSRKSLASRLARRLSGPLLFRPGHLIHTEIHNDVVQNKSRHDNAEAEQHDYRPY